MEAKGTQQLTVAAIALVVALFFASTTYLNFQSRIQALEATQSAQDQKLTAIQTQLDTINQRGSSGADQRLNALEQNVAIENTRLSRLENH